MWKLALAVLIAACSANQYPNLTFGHYQVPQSITEAVEIPEFVRALVAKETNLTAFFEKYVHKPVTVHNVTTTTTKKPYQKHPRIRGRKGPIHTTTVAPPTDAGDEVFNGDICLPVNKTVHVPANYTTSPNILIVPVCVFVERCGGCCLSDSRVCEPTETEPVEYQLKELRLRTLNDTHPELFVHRTISLTVDRHKKCACNCVRKQEDCTSAHHVYNEHTCSCDCSNHEDQRICHYQQGRDWNPETCQCECRIKHRECTSGYSYNSSSCDCQEEHS